MASHTCGSSTESYRSSEISKSTIEKLDGVLYHLAQQIVQQEKRPHGGVVIWRSSSLGASCLAWANCARCSASASPCRWKTHFNNTLVRSPSCPLIRDYEAVKPAPTEWASLSTANALMLDALRSKFGCCTYFENDLIMWNTNPQKWVLVSNLYGWYSFILM